MSKKLDNDVDCNSKGLPLYKVSHIHIPIFTSHVGGACWQLFTPCSSNNIYKFKIIL